MKNTPRSSIYDQNDRKHHKSKNAFVLATHVWLHSTRPQHQEHFLLWIKLEQPMIFSLNLRQVVCPCTCEAIKTVSSANRGSRHPRESRFAAGETVTSKLLSTDYKESIRVLLVSYFLYSLRNYPNIIVNLNLLC